MKKYLIATVIFVVVFVIGVLVIGRTFYPDNIAETSKDGGKKALKTRIYPTNLNTATGAVKEILPKLTSYGSNWRIVDESSVDGLDTVKAEVPVLLFIDDLEVKLEKVGLNGGVKVDIVSKSRVGKSDFGENARSVRKVLSALDAKLEDR